MEYPLRDHVYLHFVTIRKLVHPATRGFVDGFQKATLPSLAIQATCFWLLAMAGLTPARVWP